MTQFVRFLFDECLAAGPMVQAQLTASLRLYGSNAEIVQFYQKFPRGVEDPVWIPEIANEEGWVVVSGDRGAHSRQGEKLPQICSAFGVTHVILSAALLRRSWYFKTLAFESHWEGLIATAQSPRGTGFKLAISGEKSFSLRKMSEPPLPRTPPSQQNLFDKLDKA